MPALAFAPSTVLCKLCSEPSAVCRLPTQSVPPCRSHPRLGTHIEVGDAPVNLSPMAIGSGGRCSRGQAAVGDGACVPVGPVDAASLDVDIHGIDADALVTLEGLLISRMGVAGEQAADLIVVSDIQDLILRAWRDKSPDVGWQG